MHTQAYKILYMKHMTPEEIEGDENESFDVVENALDSLTERGVEDPSERSLYVQQQVAKWMKKKIQLRAYRSEKVVGTLLSKLLES
jgi:hypothetical protein